MAYNIGEIEATERNATRVVEIVRLDLGRAGLEASELDKYANPNDEAHINRQLDKLTKHPEQYRGAIDDSKAVEGESEKIDAYAKIAGWGHRDEDPFLTPTARGINHALGRLGIDRNGDAVGIFGLALSDDVPEGDRLQLLDDMVAECVRLASAREIFIAHYSGDPILEALNRYHFASTGRKGELVGIEQTLYRRDPRTLL